MGDSNFSDFGYFPEYSGHNLTSLSDVTLVPAPQDGETLRYDVASGKWKPGVINPPGTTLVGTAASLGLDKSIAIWDGTTGEVIKDTYLTVSDPVYDAVALKYRQRIENVSEPVAVDDAVNKEYIDRAISGLYWKDPVRATTTAPVALSGAAAAIDVDGVTLNDGDRVLVRLNVDGVENGVYIYDSGGAWTRSSDFSAGEEASNFVTLVEEGTVFAQKSFVCTNDPSSDVIGTNALVFELFTEIIIPGDALSKVNDVLNVNVDNATMQINGLNQLVCTIFPSGTIIQHVSTSVSGYLLCDGASYTRTTYPDLFAALNTSIGTVTISIGVPGTITFGAAHGLLDGQTIFLTTDGALPTGLTSDLTYYVSVLNATQIYLRATPTGPLITTSGGQSGTHTAFLTIGGVTSALLFNVPDFQGRTLADGDASYGVGSSSGAASTTLTTNNLPSHTHTFTIPDHSHSYTDTYNTYSANSVNDKIWAPLDANRTYVNGISSTSNVFTGTTSTLSGASGTIGSTGGSSSFSNYQPTFFVYSHIKI